MKLKFLQAAVAGLMLSVCSIANAGLIHFTGTLTDFDDYTLTEFSIATASNIRGWTDSFNDYENFDPIVSLWSSDGSWILTNDDNASINSATQSYYDSGFEQFLSAGTYFFTVSVFNNFAITSENLFTGSPFSTGVSQGVIDNLASNYPNMEMNYSIWLDGVDDASTSVIPSQVPEPSTLAIFALGIMGLAARRFKKQ